MVEAPGGDDLVSMDTTLPNRLVERALRSGALREFRGWTMERTEVRIGRSRFDFMLSRAGGRRLALEVKSVTLVQERVGLFPDAITARGTRHVRELAALVAGGAWEAAVLFVVQRRDVQRVTAAREIDPTFADALSSAKHAGVRVLGRRCRVELERVTLGGAVGVD